MTYKTSLDLTAKIITINVTIFFAIIIFGQYPIIKDAGRIIPIYTTVTLLAIYLITYGFRPVNYQINTALLIIHRPISDVKIDRSVITGVELLDKEQTKWSFRTFGVGGLFGYYGKFFNSKIGSMTWYATRRDKMVLIRTSDNRKIVLTPDEPERFVASLS
jgi:hypothetical protein